ncbi:ABC transporter permease [candidate division KSB1 bacterium]
MKNIRKDPPAFAEKLLYNLLNREDRDIVLGDFSEFYSEKARDSGKVYAFLWYWFQIFKSVPLFIMNSFFWSTAMFKNYAKFSFRNLRRQKAYSFINILGLAIGLGLCILIMIYIFTELSYDKYHLNAGRIYRLGTYMEFGGRKDRVPVSNFPAGPTIKEDYEEVADVVRFRRYMYDVLVEYEDKQFIERGVFYADNSVFNVFTFSLIKGDPQTALSKPFTVLLTESIAEKYFGEEDPVGKVIRLDNQENYTITGILQDIPKNSHFIFNMLCSFETLHVTQKEQAAKWTGDFNNYTYLLLKEDIDYNELEKKFTSLIESKIGHILKAVKGKLELFLQPLTDIHLHSHMMGEISGNSDIRYIYIFTAIALFILIIACINFMNLSTARSGDRAQEVGIRKVLGSNRRQLIKYFLGESVFYCLLSFIIGILLVWISLPAFSNISGIDLKLRLAELPWFFGGFTLLVLFVGIAAGSYPAFFLSAFNPVQVLKGSYKTGAQRSVFRNSLVILQFTISIALLIGSSIILNQIHYMKQKDLGFDKNNVLLMQINNDRILSSIESVKNELKSIAGVVNVTVSSHIPSHGARHNVFLPEGFDYSEAVMMGAMNVDHDFLPTLGIELISGRNFSPDYRTDPEESVIINETAARKFGWENPIGKTLTELTEAEPKKTIIGVVKDFHTISLREEIEPICMENNPSGLHMISIRILPENAGNTISMIRNKWKNIDPESPFDYQFLDRSFDNQYEAEEKLRDIFFYFTVFALFIACLGLFGLASFTAEQRKKQIGIKKVLGATVNKIVFQLTLEFIKYVMIANIIAWPAAWYGMNKWMQNFAYRDDIGWGIFVLSGFTALVIASLTVIYQALRAAFTNPVDALKNE